MTRPQTLFDYLAECRRAGLYPDPDAPNGYGIHDPVRQMLLPSGQPVLVTLCLEGLPGWLCPVQQLRRSVGWIVEEAPDGPA